MNQELPPSAQMLHIITGYWASQAVGTAAKLGIADQLGEGPKSSAQVAEAIGADASAVFRLMRMLASIGVFTLDEQERFALTPLGNTLRSGVPGSVRNFAVAETAPGHWLPWGKMYEAVTTGKPMCQSALGMDLWEWYANHSEEGEYFNGAMGDLSATAASEVIRVYDFAFERWWMSAGRTAFLSRRS